MVERMGFLMCLHTHLQEQETRVSSFLETGKNDIQFITGEVERKMNLVLDLLFLHFYFTFLYNKLHIIIWKNTFKDKQQIRFIIFLL